MFVLGNVNKLKLIDTHLACTQEHMYKLATLPPKSNVYSKTTHQTHI